MTGESWKRCSACKKPIDFGAAYWVCSVSTCNQKRTGLVFCTVSCWDAHLPVARHREAWAEERTAPARAAAAEAAEPAPRRRRLVRGAPRESGDGPPREILIVASRLKAYIAARSGMNTSERVLGPLSDIVRRLCDEAIDHAGREGRRTVLDRDIPSP